METWALAPPFLIGETVALEGRRARVRWLGRVPSSVFGPAAMVAGLEIDNPGGGGGQLDEVHGLALNTNVINGRVLFECKAGSPVLAPVEKITKVPKAPAPAPSPRKDITNGGGGGGSDGDVSDGGRKP